MHLVRLRTVALAVAVAIGATGIAHAQKAAKGSITTRSSAGRGGGTNQNIKKNDVVNSASGTEMAAPPSKGGAKTRGAAAQGRLHVDNQTPWYIRLYVDGNYRGLVEPYGDVYGWLGCGDHILYAEAPFDDGSSRTWSPVVANACGEDLVWHLRR